MSKRPSVPPIRRAPSNPLFSDTSQSPPAPKNRQVMAYLPPGQVADLDELRARLRRDSGVVVDRSQLIRAALRMAFEHPDAWAREAVEA